MKLRKIKLEKKEWEDLYFGLMLHDLCSGFLLSNEDFTSVHREFIVETKHPARRPVERNTDVTDVETLQSALRLGN